MKKLALAGTVLLCLVTSWSVYTLTVALRDAAGAFQQMTVALDGRAKELHTLVENRMDSLQRESFARIDSLQQDSFRRIDVLIVKTEKQVDLARKDLTVFVKDNADSVREAAVEEIRATRTDLIGQVGRANDSIEKLVEAYAAIPEKVEVALHPWMNCTGNGACWPAQFTAALGATRSTLGETSRTMKAIREATPSIVSNVDRTTGNVERITRPDSWLIRGLKIAGPAAAAAIVTANK